VDEKGSGAMEERSTGRERFFSFDDYDNVIGLVINQAAYCLSRDLDSIIKANGISITPREFVILNRLHQNGELTQKQLTDMDYKDAAATSRLVESLRRNGLVNRRTSRTDRRATIISLTEKGRNVRAILVPQLSDMLRTALGEASDADLEVVFETLKRVIRTSFAAR